MNTYIRVNQFMTGYVIIEGLEFTIYISSGGLSYQSSSIEIEVDII